MRYLIIHLKKHISYFSWLSNETKKSKIWIIGINYIQTLNISCFDIIKFLLRFEVGVKFLYTRGHSGSASHCQTGFNPGLIKVHWAFSSLEWVDKVSSKFAWELAPNWPLDQVIFSCTPGSQKQISGHCPPSPLMGCCASELRLVW